MSQYNATVWPAMQYPGPVSTTGNAGLTAPVEPSPAPPLEFPQPESVTLTGGIAEPSPTPVIEPPLPVLVQNIVVPAPTVSTTTYAPPYTAQQAVNSFFNIVSQPGLAANPHWYFTHLGPARAATTAALPAFTAVSLTKLVANVNGALPAIDGVTLDPGQIVLVKDEVGANAPYNGVYLVFKPGDGANPWELDRTAVDPALCVSDVTVLEGTVNAGSYWVFATDSATFTLNTTDIVWVYGSPNAYSNDPPRTGAAPYLAQYTGNV